MQKDSVFRIASMTKVVTGVAVMMMVEEGRIRITDPVSKFIPEFRNLTVAVEQPRQGPQHGGLAHAWNILDQQVPAGNQAAEREFEFALPIHQGPAGFCVKCFEKCPDFRLIIGSSAPARPTR